MKKILLFIMIFLYFGTSTGFTMHLHYCMDTLVGTKLLEQEKESCSDTCEMSEKSGPMDDCCDDLEKEVKLDQVHKAAENAFMGIKNLAISLPPSLFNFSFDVKLPGTSETQASGNSPPAWQQVPFYLRHCVFLI